MKKLSLLSTAFLAVSAAPSVLAEDGKVWKVAAEVGAIATSGNTETVTVQGKIDAVQNLQRWNNQYIFSVLFKDDQVPQGDGTRSSERTAERYFLSAKSAYKLEAENANLFVFGSHTDDKFGAYREYSTVAVGYGARMLNRDRAQLDVEIGPGYFYAVQALGNGQTETEEGAIVRAAAKFDWQVSSSADFQQVVSVESGQDNTRSIADTSLSVRVNSSMQLKVGMRLQSDSDVAPDKKKTDTTSYVNLVYRF